jgi:hypothetical protein
MVVLCRLWNDDRAASAAEFGLVVPLLTLLLFAVVDAGRFMWEYNRAEKATQVGARTAVVTDVIAPGLATADYVGQTYGGVTLTQGDRIPASALGTVSCKSVSGTVSCSCAAPDGAGPCPTLGTADSAAFNLIADRMAALYPNITRDKVRVQYRGSGLGFAGDPNGSEISPLVTVKVVGLQFQPVAVLKLAAFTMPDFATTLTAEDLSGTSSN